MAAKAKLPAQGAFDKFLQGFEKSFGAGTLSPRPLTVRTTPTR